MKMRRCKTVVQCGGMVEQTKSRHMTPSSYTLPISKPPVTNHCVRRKQKQVNTFIFINWAFLCLTTKGETEMCTTLSTLTISN